MSSTAQGLAIAAAVGVVSHLGVFIRGEWHMHVPAVLLMHLLGVAVTLYLQARFFADPASTSRVDLVYNTAQLCGAYLVGLFTSIVAYRLHFHRIRHFPGPKLAAATKWWHVWQCRDSKNFLVIDRLHEKYGDVVRIGPREIAIKHPSAHLILEGFGTQCTKSDFYDVLLPDRSLAFTRNKKEHDARRNVWSKAISSKSIQQYEPRIRRQIELLFQKLSEKAERGDDILMNEMFYWFTLDSMGEFAFNEDFGNLREARWHWMGTMLHEAVEVLGPFLCMVWLIKFGFFFFFWTWKFADWFKMIHFSNDLIAKRMKVEPKDRDIASHFIEAANASGMSEDAVRWLQGDAVTVVVGGSDTSAASLVSIFYFLAKHPEHVEKIRSEIEEAKVDLYNYSSVAALAHLNGCINEAMRLLPVVTTVTTRDTPKQGVQIGDTYIPGDVKVLASRWSNSRDERGFAKATEFIPERWYSKPELIYDGRAFSPFGNGRGSCVGQGLAQIQIRMVLAIAVSRFDLKFRANDDGSKVLEEFRDVLTAKPGPLVLKLVPRAA